MKTGLISRHSATAWQMGACALVLLIMGGFNSARAQVTFTPITEGPLVEDTGFFNSAYWGDYDNDGFVDVLLGQRESGQTAHLYHNNGDGTFTRITEGIVATDPTAPTGAAWVDQDNDGDLDLFIATYDSLVNVFYRNEGAGTFTKVTEGDWVNTPASSDLSAWGDYDNDGWVDLYVANDGPKNFLYHNNGDGTMESLSVEANSLDGASHGCMWTDYDGDGDVDLFVGGQSKVQFRNDGNGVFTWITPENGGVPSVVEDIGFASADYDNDGDLDVVRGSPSANRALLYRNDGEAGFVDVSNILPDGGSGDPGGLSWGDYDNDGHQDLYISNLYDTDGLLYHNEGDGSFTLIADSPVAGSGLHSGGSTWVDYDNDGDLDLFVANGLFVAEVQPCELYRNDGGTSHWIALDLVGNVSNRSAVGAKVWAEATIDGQAVTQMREISGGGNGQSQAGLRVHFGLGDATAVDTLRVEWPSGAIQEWTDVAADQFLTIEEEYLGKAVANISTRGQVGTGDDVLIAGLVISGNVRQKVLIRASGPTLGTFDVSGVLEDTVLTLFTSDGAQVATNTNWGDAANADEIAAAIESLGAFAFPSGSKDSAILITLDPGGYTAKVSGNGGTTGNAIVEIYTVE